MKQLSAEEIKSGKRLPEAKKLNQFMREAGQTETFRVLGEISDKQAIFAVDADRKVIFWNKGAEKLLGFPAGQAIGQHCLKVNRCHNCMLGCGIAEYGEVNNIPLILYRADGHPLALRKTARAFFDKEGQFLGGIEMLVADESAVAQPIPDIPADTVNFHGLLSRSPSMHRVFDIVRNVADTDVAVLVRGDSGSGKELIARAVHQESHRRKGPFLSINCAALTPTLLESELFGHAKGAFTGAVRDRPGLFQLADGGTLFLDEVAELPLELQAKLLRVLQEKSFFPVGSTQQSFVDVRIIAATHRSLREMVQSNTFREDLMYRLRVVPLYLPPLRDRREDVEALLWHFIKQRNKRGRRQIHTIAPETMRMLLNHSWPGNVRELQNVLDYAFAVGRGTEFQFTDLPPEFSETQPLRVGTHSMPLPPSQQPQASAPPVTSAAAAAPSPLLDERQRIIQALEQAHGHVGKAAALLGMSRPTFWRKRKKYGLDQ